jgi:hypothetical protein
MQTPGCAILKNLTVVGAFAFASLPVSAQRISADAVKNGHFPRALRGHLDRRPDRSIQYPPFTGNQTGSSTAVWAARPAQHPNPIVSTFFYPSSRSGSVNYGFIVGANPFSDQEGASTSVNTYLIPLVITVHQVATDFTVDADNNLVLTGIKNQDATYDPTRASPACLGKTNNVPFTLAVQSPVFQNNHWVLGGTDLGGAVNGWTEMEFNVFGDGNGEEATFNLGSTLVVRNSVLLGTATKFKCEQEGTSGESNNLILSAESPLVAPVGRPSMVFIESYSKETKAVGGCSCAVVVQGTDPPLGLSPIVAHKP